LQTRYRTIQIAVIGGLASIGADSERITIAAFCRCRAVAAMTSDAGDLAILLIAAIMSLSGGQHDSKA
jgi:hypothetical protein